MTYNLMQFTPIVDGYDVVAHLEAKGIAERFGLSSEELTVLKQGGSIPTQLFIKAAVCIVFAKDTFPANVQTWMTDFLEPQAEAIPDSEAEQFIGNTFATMSEELKAMTAEIAASTARLEASSKLLDAQFAEAMAKLDRIPDATEAPTRLAKSPTPSTAGLTNIKHDPGYTVVVPEDLGPGKRTLH